MEIRIAAVGDADAVALVHVLSWQAAYRGLLPANYLDGLDPDGRRSRWARRIGQADWPRREVLVATAASAVAGFISTGPSRDEDAGANTGEVVALYAEASVWGSGVGRALMCQGVAGLRSAGYAEATLWVLRDNRRANAFYERAGWRPDGAVKQI